MSVQDMYNGGRSQLINLLNREGAPVNFADAVTP